MFIFFSPLLSKHLSVVCVQRISFFNFSFSYYSLEVLSKNGKKKNIGLMPAMTAVTMPRGGAPNSNKKKIVELILGVSALIHVYQILKLNFKLQTANCKLHTATTYRRLSSDVSTNTNQSQ